MTPRPNEKAIGLKAELLLNDCRRAIDLHSDQYQKEEFRLSWFTIVCLLRAIGHVLDKVDFRDGTPELKKIIKEKWDETNRNSPTIFCEFIKKERDRFIKEYVHNVDRSISSQLYMAGKDGPTLVNVSINVGDSQNSSFEGPNPIKSVIKSGPYKGRNEKEVAMEALKWWEDYIADLKNRLKKVTHSNA